MIARLLLPCSLLVALLALPARAAEPGRFTPSGSPATAFGMGVPDSSRACPRSALADAIAASIANLRRENAKLPEIAPEGRLCAAAEAFLPWDSKETPSLDVLRFVSEHAGVPGIIQAPAFALIESEDPAQIAENVAEAISGFAGRARSPRYGFATQRVRRGPRDIRTRTVLVLFDGSLVLEPVPRRLEPGASARIAGKLTGELDKAKVFISDAAGALTTADGPTASFAAEVRCGPRPGTIRVEIRGEDGGTPALVSRFPVACGTALETSISLAAAETWSGDMSAQARRMVEALNTERAGAGLAKLTWDDGLAAVAAGVAEAIKKEALQGAFDVPKDLAERLKKAGIASPVILQNPAQGRSVQEVAAQLALSPGARSGYLNPDITNVGVAAVPYVDGEGRSLVIVDQLFTKELPPLDVPATREKLRAAVAQKRKDGRYPPVTPSATLDEFAQRLAMELAAAGGNLPKARRDELAKALDKEFRTVSLTSGARQDPLDFAEEPEVTSPGKLFGVGVAQGMHEKLGRNAVYAVIAVGQERGGKDAEPAPTKKAKKK